MLDDLEFIARFDSQNALGLTAGQAEQLTHGVDVAVEKQKYRNVVLVGMGGSALAALLCKDWWWDQLEVPFEIVRGYELPQFVGKDSLVIISSYSGNTEEVVACYGQARERKAAMAVMSSGGKLQDLSAQDSVPFAEIPGGIQPRMSTGYQMKILSVLFEQAGLLKGVVKELEASQDFLTKQSEQWLPTVKTASNQAKQIAETLMGKAVWVYGSPLLAHAAYKWKISLNESSKNLASYNEFPEFNHNEFLGWTSHPVEKPFGVVELQSNFDNERITKRFEVTNRLLSGKMPNPIQISAEGESKVAQILYTVMLGDFVSLYLAVLNGVNPTPVELIEKLKKELG